MTGDETVPKRWRDLNSTQRDILVTLGQIGPSNGVEINRALGRADTSIGTINNNLASLRNQGLVSTTIPAERATDEKINGLSDAGADLVWDAVVAPAEIMKRRARNDSGAES